jgi:hypothetical protein
MIDQPSLIVAASFQQAWIAAARDLSAHAWERRNLVVQMEQPTAFDESSHDAVCAFAQSVGILSPRSVAYTIFPQGLWERLGTADAVFREYNREGGMYDRLRHLRRGGWGTYFERMTHYESSRPVNQLAKIINAINGDDKVHKAAYTVVIPIPGGENCMPMGAPCLNYLAVQLDRGASRELGLLAVYRNHDFLKKAYGNYWGLCNLTKFLAAATHFDPGPVTCISSHAYVDGHKREFMRLLESLT